MLTTWFGWTLILRGELTLGSYIAFTAYLGYLTGPVTEITSLVSTFQQTAVTLARMFEYLDLPPEQEPAGVYAPLSSTAFELTGAIELAGVSFEYLSNRHVLKDVSININEGEILTIVGESGAGKSTILRLMAGFDYPTAGIVTIGGQDIKHIPPQEVRKGVTLLWQECGLLRGTIWDNLTTGLADVQNDVVEMAVRCCVLSDMIRHLPDGYTTPVGEAGATLSSGQRQRLAIARALIRGAPVLLLDEATSNLDVATERRLLNNLLTMYRGRTIVYVTHRISNAIVADRIAVVAEGGIVGLGSHVDLMASCPVYKELQQAGTREPVQSSVHIVAD